MEKNTHETIKESYDINKELRRLYRLFFVEKIIPVRQIREIKYFSVAHVATKYFSLWKHGGICRNLDEYIEILNRNSKCQISPAFDPSRYTPAELVDIAILNAEFYYNLFAFVNWVRCNVKEYRYFATTVNGAQFQKLHTILLELIDHMSAKVVEEENLKYIIVPINAAAIAVAESESNPITRINVQKYLHYSLNGDLEAKRTILSTLALDYDKGGQRDSGTPEDGFCFIANNTFIRHNPPLRGAKSITDGMGDEQIEDVYDLAYKLYLTAKLNDEYKYNLKSRVDELKKTLDG